LLTTTFCPTFSTSLPSVSLPFTSQLTAGVGFPSRIIAPARKKTGTGIIRG
jgi:hypothetical protein